MLLKSNRHRVADLALWAELEAADFVHGEQLSRSRRGEIAIEVMRKFSDEGPCYVATSWGKDSTVLAHLLHLSGLQIPLVNIAQHGLGYDQYVPDVRDDFLSRFPVAEYHEEVVDLLPIPANGKRSPALDIGIRRVSEKYQTSRYIGGIRAAESGVRKISIKMRGIATTSSCHPIGWWSADDVFGWLAYHNLPVHPSYAMLGGGRWNREQIRVSTIGGPKGTERGRVEWETEYYGDILRKIHCQSANS
jgi:phosphoadenosine phosphosulfate reductase